MSTDRVQPRAGENDRDGFAATVHQQHPAGGPAGERKEVGDAASSREHPPHLTENDESEAIPAEHDNAAEVPALPANAGGRDTMTTAEHDQGIEPTSMYERRPSEDKDQPPSERAD